jgi:hypothetical protein
MGNGESRLLGKEGCGLGAGPRPDSSLSVNPSKSMPLRDVKNG